MVGIVSAVAIGGAAAVLMLRPWDGIDGGDGGGESTTIELAVPMWQDWTETGLWCDEGDTFDIEMSGEAHHDATEESLVGPDGLTGGEVPEARVFADANTAAVIGALDSTQEAFDVGWGTTYTCPAGGNLFLGINDTNLEGNHGEFHATITHTPAAG